MNFNRDFKNAHADEQSPFLGYILSAVVGGGFWVLIFVEATR